MERMSSLTGTEAIPTNELAQLQNKILRELRRIHGSQKIPRNLTIDVEPNKFEIIRKFSLLHSKLKEIGATPEASSIAQSPLQRALENVSLSRSISNREALRRQISEAQGAIPLCIPNNYRWIPSEGRLELLQDVQRTGLEPCAEGLELLRSITGPVCVVCVVGPARSGKSYLLGQLLGIRFRLGHTMKAETMGIWIGQQTIEHQSRSGKVTVIFLDSEGIGSTDSKDTTDSTDNQIFTLSVLISSLLIYNSKNVPNNTDLEKLHFVSKLSDSIRVRSHAENTREDVQKFKKCSPEFFWLIRDVSLEITDVNDRPCDIKTYLNQKILKEESGLSQSVSRKNEIRRNIKSFFQSVDAFTLPVPSDQQEILKNMSNADCKEFLNQEFVEKMKNLKILIADKYQPKKGINDSLLTGRQLADMVENYVNALNTKGYVPDWQSAWEMTVKMAYQRAGELAFEIYQGLMSSLTRAFPCAEAEIMAEHEEGLKNAIQLFREETLMDPDVEQFEAYIKEFTKRCASYQEDGRCDDGLLFTYLKQNKECSERFCSDMIQDLITYDLEPVLQNLNHQTSYEYILFVIGEIESKYWDCALGPSARDVYQRYLSNLEERKKQSMRTIRQLEDYNNEMETQKLETARIQMECEEREQENERIQRQREAQAKQHLDEIQAIKKANEAKIRQLREESDNAMETQRGFLNEVKKQGTKNMESLRQQNMRNEAQRNQQIRELQQSQAGLNQKIQEATQKVQVLQNRPPIVVHHKKKGCCVM